MIGVAAAIGGVDGPLGEASGTRVARPATGGAYSASASVAVGVWVEVEVTVWVGVPLVAYKAGVNGIWPEASINPMTSITATSVTGAKRR